MKILSGNLKGRNITINQRCNFRPTLSRIREDIFNLISHNKDLNIILKNSIFCDLFCGSGSIGLEAISRGAEKVIFNDLDNLNIQIVKNFLIKEKIKNYEIYCNNAYDTNLSYFKCANVIYLDPPYENELAFLIENIYTQIRKGSLIILETNQKISHNDLVLNKIYKKKNLFFIKKTIET